MFIGMLPQKKPPKNSTLKMQKQEKASSSPKDVIYSLVLTAIQI